MISTSHENEDSPDFEEKEMTSYVILVMAGCSLLALVTLITICVGCFLGIRNRKRHRSVVPEQIQDDTQSENIHNNLETGITVDATARE